MSGIDLAISAVLANACERFSFGTYCVKLQIYGTSLGFLEFCNTNIWFDEPSGSTVITKV